MIATINNSYKPGLKSFVLFSLFSMAYTPLFRIKNKKNKGDGVPRIIKKKEQSI
jgi:hypothetical protein